MFVVYGTTCIDRFRHSLSGMAETATRNLYLTRKRENLPIAITVSRITFVLLEVFELLCVNFTRPFGFIQPDP